MIGGLACGMSRLAFSPDLLALQYPAIFPTNRTTPAATLIPTSPALPQSTLLYLNYLSPNIQTTKHPDTAKAFHLGSIQLHAIKTSALVAFPLAVPKPPLVCFSPAHQNSLNSAAYWQKPIVATILSDPESIAVPVPMSRTWNTWDLSHLLGTAGGSWTVSAICVISRRFRRADWQSISGTGSESCRDFDLQLKPWSLPVPGARYSGALAVAIITWSIDMSWGFCGRDAGDSRAPENTNLKSTLRYRWSATNASAGPDGEQLLVSIINKVASWIWLTLALDSTSFYKLTLLL